MGQREEYGVRSGAGGRGTADVAVAALACAAQFMVVLDISVVNVALPSIRRALGLAEGSQ
ncbi:hypothetical protein [Amycolatopsis aidingensis]|uniref:hypothetical protein n=1 Tax=Amycolatopsis aidingensis TaxID=2842453 RepID=UPI001E2BBF27|nr:hypothetical protein [Amycolatopsis aidingensis]